MNTSPATYQPGICNINRTEIAQRRRIGHFGLSAFIVILIVLLGVNLSRYSRIILLLPAVLGASGYLQARNKFCVGYAGAGMQNVTEGSTEASAINDAAAKSLDKRRARRINLQSIGIGLLATVLALCIPHL